MYKRICTQDNILSSFYLLIFFLMDWNELLRTRLIAVCKVIFWCMLGDVANDRDYSYKLPIPELPGYYVYSCWRIGEDLYEKNATRKVCPVKFDDADKNRRIYSMIAWDKYYIDEVMLCTFLRIPLRSFHWKIECTDGDWLTPTLLNLKVTDEELIHKRLASYIVEGKMIAGEVLSGPFWDIEPYPTKNSDVDSNDKVILPIHNNISSEDIVCDNVQSWSETKKSMIKKHTIILAYENKKTYIPDDIVIGLVNGKPCTKWELPELLRWQEVAMNNRGVDYTAVSRWVFYEGDTINHMKDFRLPLPSLPKYLVNAKWEIFRRVMITKRTMYKGKEIGVNGRPDVGLVVGKCNEYLVSPIKDKAWYRYVLLRWTTTTGTKLEHKVPVHRIVWCVFNWLDPLTTTIPLRHMDKKKYHNFLFNIKYVGGGCRDWEAKAVE